MATFALLQASMVAVNSDSFSAVTAKPAEKRTSILRPGTVRKFLARLRTDSNMVRAKIGLRVVERGESGGCDCNWAKRTGCVRGVRIHRGIFHSLDRCGQRVRVGRKILHDA